MSTLKDFLPNFVKIDPNAFQQAICILFAIVLFIWAIVSSIMVLANGGSFFDEKCGSSNDVIWKYSSPFWRKIT